MDYTGVAVVRRSDDELKHYKYIKKIKMHGGKTRYIYESGQLKSDAKKAITDTVNKITGEQHAIDAKKYSQRAEYLDDASNLYLTKAENAEDAKDKYDRLSKHTDSTGNTDASEDFRKISEDAAKQEKALRNMSYQKAGEAAVQKYLSEQSMAKYEKTIAYKVKKATNWLKSVLGIG